MLEQAPGPVGWVGLLWILFVGVWLPFAVWRGTQRAASAELPERERYLTAAVIQLAVLGALGIAVAHVEYVELFPAYAFEWSHVAAGIAALAGFVALNWKRWEQKVRRGERRVHLVSPRTPKELALWTAVCVCAGVGEEIVYRALLPALVGRITESAPVAIAVAVLAFGLGHLNQGWSGVLVTALFAVIAHALVGFTQTLVIAMAVHFAYDLIAGLRYAALAKRLGYTPATAENA